MYKLRQVILAKTINKIGSFSIILKKEAYASFDAIAKLTHGNKLFSRCRVDSNRVIEIFFSRAHF